MISETDREFHRLQLKQEEKFTHQSVPKVARKNLSEKCSKNEISLIFIVLLQINYWYICVGGPFVYYILPYFHLKSQQNIDFFKKTLSDRNDEGSANETFYGNESHIIYDTKTKLKTKTFIRSIHTVISYANMLCSWIDTKNQRQVRKTNELNAFLAFCFTVSFSCSCSTTIIVGIYWCVHALFTANAYSTRPNATHWNSRLLLVSCIVLI